jgi:RimJ/RimL family protein N-acetyltransferase
MTTLKSDPINLRCLHDTDQSRLAELCNNRKIWDNVRDFLPSPYTELNALEFIKRCQEENPTVTFAIEYKGELAGCIGLVRQTDIYRLTAEIGYWIGEPFWGLGIATKAVGLITEYGFNQLELIRIYTGVFDFNIASQRVLEKSGFIFEGIFEKSVIKNGHILNEYRYAKLK